MSAIREVGDLGFKVIQTTASASPGSSCGAILDAKGELVAILSFKMVGGENLNFGIPVNYTRGMLDSHEPFSLIELAGRVVRGLRTNPLRKPETQTRRVGYLAGQTEQVQRIHETGGRRGTQR